MVTQMNIGNKTFNIGNHTYIMAILNITPDSFSDGGSYNNIDAALKQTELLIKDGADIIDIGGESTRPGYTMISPEEEIMRVAPVIRAIKSRFDIPVSVDTYKSLVAKEALIQGADLINDIWGFKYDDQMAAVVKAYNGACCLMHNRDKAGYNNLIQDCIDQLKQSIDIAKAAEIPENKIMIDPGVGFGKTLEDNLKVIHHLEKFNALGFPVLLGASRKSCIGFTLDVPVDDRLIGTTVTSVMAVMAHTAFVRVHDVKENVQAIKMAEAILYAQ